MLKLSSPFALLVVLMVTVSLGACSSSGSNVRSVANGVDRSSAQGVKLAIVEDDLQLSSQQGGELYTLLNSKEQVLALAQYVARYYGFSIVPESQASYVLSFKEMVPDGGACVEGVDAAELNFSYSLSLLTLGAFPATSVHCLQVVADLYSNDFGQRELMAEFTSNSGEVEVVGGINNVVQYQRNVSLENEMKGLEASIGSMLNEIIDAGAFLR